MKYFSEFGTKCLWFLLFIAVGLVIVSYTLPLHYYSKFDSKFDKLLTADNLDQNLPRAIDSLHRVGEMRWVVMRWAGFVIASVCITALIYDRPVNVLFTNRNFSDQTS